MKTKSPSRLRLLVAIVVLTSCIGCDQATKKIATQTLANEPAVSFFGDTIRFDFAHNSGGFLSLGSKLPDNVRMWIFVGFNACMILVLSIFIFLHRNISLSLFVTLLLILSGGIGNLIDRVRDGGLVTDFINVGIGPLRTGVFNVADMAIIFGAIGVVGILVKDDTLGRSGGARCGAVGRHAHNNRGGRETRPQQQGRSGGARCGAIGRHAHNKGGTPIT